jgi:hypothetical protein
LEDVVEDIVNVPGHHVTTKNRDAIISEGDILNYKKAENENIII